MKDLIFYPDRSATETAAFINKGRVFFKTAIRRRFTDRAAVRRKK